MVSNFLAASLFQLEYILIISLLKFTGALLFDKHSFDKEILIFFIII